MSKYITNEGTDVTERIKEGKTKVFDTEILAYKYAQLHRRYKYPLYREIKGKRTQVGFAVPN